MNTLSKVFVLGAALALGACANLNPFSAANSLEQKSYALYGSFVVFEEVGAKLILSPEVPNSVKRAIQQADAAAKPVVDELKNTADAYISIKLEVEAGSGSKEQLAVVANSLSRWYSEAQPKVRCLIKAVEGKPCSN